MLENRFISADRVMIDGIPSLKFRPIDAGGTLPTVIFYHGWSSSKDNKRFQASIVACYGYQVIVPDAIYHGERGHIEYQDPEVMEEYFWQVVLQTVEESRRIITGIIENHNADPERIGVMGSSMGGFIASGVFIDNPAIKCLVNLNGSCAWVKADQMFRNKAGRPPACPEELSRLSKYDPMANKHRLGQRPILMLHGDADSLVPVECQRVFYSDVISLYGKSPEKLRLVEVPRMDHYISTGMMEEAIEWLGKYL